MMDAVEDQGRMIREGECKRDFHRFSSPQSSMEERAAMLVRPGLTEFVIVEDRRIVRGKRRGDQALRTPSRGGDVVSILLGPGIRARDNHFNCSLVSSLEAVDVVCTQRTAGC